MEPSAAKAFALIRATCDEYLRAKSVERQQWIDLLTDTDRAIRRCLKPMPPNIAGHLAKAMTTLSRYPIDIPVFVHELEFAIWRTELALGVPQRVASRKTSKSGAKSATIR